MTSSFPHSMTPFLDKLEARSSLSNAERESVLSLPFYPRHVNANQDFVQRGEDVTHSCFILAGLVGTFAQNKRGDRQITSVFLTGDMIDLQTVVEPEALVSLQALTPSTILQVPHSALRAAARQHPGLAEAFWRECVVNAAILSEWVLNVGRRDARARLAHLFCEVACRAGFSGQGNAFSFPFPISQNQLADMLGLTPVHVNRTLKGLREDKFVDVVHRTVQILNWARLAQIGEFDPTYLRLGNLNGQHKPSANEGRRPMPMLQ